MAHGDHTYSINCCCNCTSCPTCGQTYKYYVPFVSPWTTPAPVYPKLIPVAVPIKFKVFDNRRWR